MDRRAESLATSIAEQVDAIMGRADREATDAKDGAARQAETQRREAEAEAARLIHDAARTAGEAAARQIERIVELRRAIAQRCDEIAVGIDDNGVLQSRIGVLLDALSAVADRLAQEAAVQAASDVRSGEGWAAQSEERYAEPLEPVERTRANARTKDPSAAHGSSAAPTANGPAAPQIEVQSYAEARLHALTLAIDGAGRAELETELRETMKPHDALEVVNEVLGQAPSPFRRWARAIERTRPR